MGKDTFDLKVKGVSRDVYLNFLCHIVNRFFDGDERVALEALMMRVVEEELFVDRRMVRVEEANV